MYVGNRAHYKQMAFASEQSTKHRIDYCKYLEVSLGGCKGMQKVQLFERLGITAVAVGTLV